VLAADRAVTAVFCGNDQMALGLLRALSEAGRRIPADVGVVGFDDSTWALRTQPPLSTVHQPAREIGRNAAELVLRQLRGEDPVPGNVLLPTPIVWRDSA
jgi:DNA-binding LacI/PurR family transcriptional regulator